jgi:hypothetical protein
VFDGLDFLGAVTPAAARTQQSQAKAAAAGQRALAAAQRIAQVAPRLAAAVQKAGQKAIAASKGAVKPVTPAKPTAAAKPAPGAQKTPPKGAPKTAPMSSRGAPAPSKAPSNSFRAPHVSPGRGAAPGAKTHVGDMSSALSKIANAANAAIASGDAQPPTDMTPEDAAQLVQQQTADTYSQLADAAVSAADLLSEIQGLLNKLPAGIPLAQQGQSQVADIENRLVTPIEHALEGGPGASSAQGLVAYVQQIAAQRNTVPPNPGSIWEWVAQANAYLKAHGAAGAVASIAINPSSPTIAPGAVQQFTAAVADATGMATTPGSPVKWSATPGSTIDKNGNFSATSPGSFVVTASADGIKGTTTVTVQAGAASTATTPAGTVTVQPQSPTVAPGSIQQFTATVSSTTGQPAATAPAISWSVTPTGGAMIDANGNFVAQIPGTYTITATSGGVTGTTTATVSPAGATQPFGGGFGGGGGGGGFGGGGGGGGSYGDGGGGGDSDYGPDGGDAGYGDDDGGAQADDSGDDDTTDDGSDDQGSSDVGGLDLLGAEPPPAFAAKVFSVDKSSRGDGTYILHGVGDASGIGPGMAVYTPDGIIWDVASVDADKRGLTATKLRSDVSFTAWLSGDWSRFYSDIKAVAPQGPTLAQRAAEVTEQAAEKLDTGVRYAPWLIAAGVAAVAIPAIAGPLVSMSTARRLAFSR